MRVPSACALHASAQRLRAMPEQRREQFFPLWPVTIPIARTITPTIADIADPSEVTEPPQPSRSSRRLMLEKLSGLADGTAISSQECETGDGVPPAALLP